MSNILKRLSWLESKITEMIEVQPYPDTNIGDMLSRIQMLESIVGNPDSDEDNSFLEYAETTEGMKPIKKPIKNLKPKSKYRWAITALLHTKSDDGKKGTRVYLRRYPAKIRGWKKWWTDDVEESAHLLTKEIDANKILEELDQGDKRVDLIECGLRVIKLNQDLEEV